MAGAPAIAQAAAEGPGGFAEHLDQVPVMLVLLADLSRLATVDRDSGHYTMVGGASIYPFAWSILLAARAEGLAGVMTTMAGPGGGRGEGGCSVVPEPLAVAGVLALGSPGAPADPVAPRPGRDLRHRRPVRRAAPGSP